MAMKTIYSDRLIYLRERVGLNKTDTAKILNIDQSLYIKYEQEIFLIPLKHLNTLCNYYNVSLDYVFNFSNINNYKNSKDKVDKNIVGRRLKEFRKENNLTQKKLANILNVANTILCEYEKGHYLISISTLYEICKKYSISADYLLGKTDNPKYIDSAKK